MSKSFFMIANEEVLCFILFVGQEKLFEDATLVSGKYHSVTIVNNSVNHHRPQKRVYTFQIRSDVMQESSMIEPFLLFIWSFLGSICGVSFARLLSILPTITQSLVCTR